MSVQRTRVNDMIRISPLRVIGPDNEQLGVIELDEAKRLAREAGLDLVEVSPDSRPPVCKIMDYGKYKYQLSKKEQKQRAGSKKSELKEVRLGRSLRIDPHDVELRLDKAREFILEGHKVQFVQPIQGREMQHKHMGVERLREIEEKFKDIAKCEMPARLNGRRAMMILAPDKAKIQQAKRSAPKETVAEKASVGDD
ncbi:MAG: translation initiation factor IF-3 [Phycisphaerales bacterium]